MQLSDRPAAAYFQLGVRSDVDDVEADRSKRSMKSSRILLSAGAVTTHTHSMWEGGMEG